MGLKGCFKTFFKLRENISNKPKYHLSVIFDKVPHLKMLKIDQLTIIIYTEDFKNFGLF